MKRDIKTEILETAKQLFNEHGYNQVSMRNIADSLGISVGNLTYHYKKKEDLVEAVILKQHESYQRFPVPKTLEELDRFFVKREEHQKKNDYYFRHYVQLAQISKKVYNIQVKVLTDMRDTLYGAFSNLHAAGLIKEEALEDQWQYLARSLVTILIFGGGYMRQKRRETLWSLVFPLLTEVGVREYLEKIK